MDEVNEELLGRLQGYLNWASEIAWHKKRHDSIKKQSLFILKKQQKKGYAANAQIFKQLFEIVVKKQVPLHSQKVHVQNDIKETMNLLKCMFNQSYTEMFVEDAVYASETMYQYSVFLHDAVSRQALLLKAINNGIYNDILPQLLFLCDKEAEIKQKLQANAHDALTSSVRVLEHINDNYFVCMKKLASDSQYIEDHRPLFVAGYSVLLSSKILAALYDVSVDSMTTEEAFCSNLIKKQIGFPSENQKTLYMSSA